MPRLILAPSDSGRRDWRMGAGPTDLLRHGADRRLGAEVVTVDGSYDEVQRAVADEVTRAVADRVAPVVLAGNCGASVGVVAGWAASDDLAVVWLDAHGDLNTPETTTSGFVDGMALAMLTGRCPAALPEFRPVPDEQVLLVGARDLDPAERAVLDESAIRLLPARAAEVARAELPSRVRRVHLHVDLDVHDAERAGRANEFAVPGGPDAAEVRDVVEAVSARWPVVSATFAAYDPAADTEGTIRAAALRLIELVGAKLT
ncbi:arginase family protein [Amycolatopsis australiensis]|uniref:Arginase n=1 Tax=Amycolatopsis australiensis TaxID=546364 RepID=A0A1K1QGH2_9PSEU|nr:arginase family protein [Amycolatopsis australiensis]SFW58310.1 arginase [Amycolatopsis australiensis]